MKAATYHARLQRIEGLIENLLLTTEVDNSLESLSQIEMNLVDIENKSMAVLFADKDIALRKI